MTRTNTPPNPKQHARDLKRYAARMKKQVRWSKPLTTPWDNMQAYLNMWIEDHGIFREAYVNFHRVTDDVWRAAQPAPRHIKRWHQMGLKTIITLRGGRGFGAWPLEEKTCADLGIKLYEATLRSRDVPDLEALDHFLELIKTVEKPVLIHCKSGADRAGLASALYLLENTEKSPEEALEQLSWQYGHIKSAKTGILDHMLNLYLIDKNTSDQSLTFRNWLAKPDQPNRIKSTFRPKGLASWWVDRILRRE